MDNKTYVLRRLTETAVIELISSGVIFLLVAAELIPATRNGYIGSFGASALLFLIFNYIVLYAHFWALHFDKLKYLAVNLSIWTVGMLTSLIGIKYFPADVYTAFFGYTKPFRQLFNMSATGSALLFWALYLILIVFVVVKILHFDWRYKQRCIDKADRELERLEMMEEEKNG